ncbi:MAG: hypothetical protein AAF518_08235, partial [Spirochaetota bacterium]
KGSYTWADGTVLKAKWKRGEPNGQGKLIFQENQVVLNGEYKNGVIYNGSGMYIYDDNNRYIGEWKKGKREGNGVLFDASGKVLKKGTWKADKFVK